MANIDTIREALDQAKRDFDLLAGIKDDDFDAIGIRNYGLVCGRGLDEALSALSTIDPDAKPQGITMKSTQELIDEIQNIKWLIDEGPAHVKLTEAQVGLTNLKDSITAHDDAIRRDCAEKIKRLAIRNINGSMIVNMDNAIAAILGSEPAREES